MAKSYLVAHIRVHDKEEFENFKWMSGSVISEYGGKVLVLNPEPEIREGDKSGVVIVIEFDLHPIVKFVSRTKLGLPLSFDTFAFITLYLSEFKISILNSDGETIILFTTII